MYAIHLFLNGKKGISGYQLMRETGVTYKTAWRMLKQIRFAMGNVKNKQFMDTIIEIDESYIGGKPKKQNNHGKSNSKRGRGTNKTPVVGVLDRKNRQIFAQVSMPNKEGKKLTGKQLLSILSKAVSKPTKVKVISDEFKGYNILKKTDFTHHLRINHREAFVKGDVHTNNIESFWAVLKRGILGIVSTKGLQSYVNEFCFRYNNRNKDMFTVLLRQTIIRK
jgi:ISXO2-like transposase domain